MKLFKVNGYWKNDHAEFNGYLISESDDCPKGYQDDDIFFYGLSEDDIKQSSVSDALEFVITEYTIVEN